MTSTINTNGINGNYPTPGQNNNSQGFRDNFTAIKNNLNTAGSEISEVQNSAVLKTALSGIPLDNNMANTLISNAAVRTFRNTTYNLGNNVSGTVIVDCTLGDVQFATITGNTTFQFAGWAPTATKHSITLDLTVANTDAFLLFPAEVVGSGDILENNITVSGNLAIAKAPHDVTNLVYDFSTIDCGNTILVEPVNRSYQITQIEQREAIIPTGYVGDRNGDIAFSTVIEPQTVTDTGNVFTAGTLVTGREYIIVSTGDTDFTLIGAADSNPGTVFVATGPGAGTGTVSDNTLYTDNTTGFYIGMPVEFTGQNGNVVYGGVSAGTDYYVTFVEDNISFAVSTTLNGSNIALSTGNSTMQVSPIKHVYYATGTFDSTVNTVNLHETTASSDLIELAATSPNVASYGLNQPIVFSGSDIELTAGGLEANTSYYISTIDTGGANTKVSVSRSRTNGVADGNVSLSDHTFTSNIALGNVYTQGHDIWKRSRLDSF
tara:strand:+ start:3021 stop:4493 length:1473 start_codon:yes stop_codon:yes gene_type:complete